MNKLNLRQYQQCTRCVMDTDATDIVFDQYGVCNYCSEFLERSRHILGQNPVRKKEKLQTLILRSVKKSELKR